MSMSERDTLDARIDKNKLLHAVPWLAHVASLIRHTPWFESCAPRIDSMIARLPEPAQRSPELLARLDAADWRIRAVAVRETLQHVDDPRVVSAGRDALAWFETADHGDAERQRLISVLAALEAEVAPPSPRSETPAGYATRLAIHAVRYAVADPEMVGRSMPAKDRVWEAAEHAAAWAINQAAEVAGPLPRAADLEELRARSERFRRTADRLAEAILAILEQAAEAT